MIDSEALLRAVLKMRPRAGAEDMRAAHPVFRAMSNDHLNMRIAAALPRRAATGGK